MRLVVDGLSFISGQSQAPGIKPNRTPLTRCPPISVLLGCSQFLGGWLSSHPALTEAQRHHDGEHRRHTAWIPGVGRAGHAGDVGRLQRVHRS